MTVRGSVSVLLFLFSIAIAPHLFPSWSVALAAEYRDVIINELNWAGSSKSTADEWIELKNLTDTVVDISGWRIEGAATSGGTLTIPASSSIPAQGFFLIANFAATSSQSTLDTTPDWVTTSVSLRNSNVFYRVTDNTGKHIDEADDGSGSPLAGDNTTKASMERNRYVGGGTVAGGWHNSHQTVNFDSGVNQLGTPKAENNALPTITLGRVSPGSTASGEKNQFKVDYEIYDPDGIGDITLAQIDLRELGANLFDLDIQSAHAEYVIEPSHMGGRAWSITVTDRQGASTTNPKILKVFQGAGLVEISEILPRPQEGSDFEWIELYNRAAHTINLSEFKLDDIADGGSSPYQFPVGTEIKAGSYLVVEKAEHGLNLNDDGDLVRLLDPNGYKVRESSNWGRAPKGSSFALVDGSWQWTTQLTKGSLNQANPTVSDTPAVNPVPEVQPVNTPGVQPAGVQPATPDSEFQPVTPEQSQQQPLAERSPPVVQPSKKLVKGVTITRRTEPVRAQRTEHQRVIAAVAAAIVAKESLLLWSRKRSIAN